MKSNALNKKIGIRYFKWIVKNTFFKFFNQALKVDNRTTDLVEIRRQMTLSEISHLLGFGVVALVAIFQSVNVSLIFGLAMMIPNILLNLYPCLLQQENKRRIDRVINRQNSGANRVQ